MTEAAANSVVRSAAPAGAQESDHGLLGNDQDADVFFKDPYIDIDERRETPVHHRYLHGGFGGTDTRFSVYLPPADQYQGGSSNTSHRCPIARTLRSWTQDRTTRLPSRSPTALVSWRPTAVEPPEHQGQGLIPRSPRTVPTRQRPNTQGSSQRRLTGTTVPMVMPSGEVAAGSAPSECLIPRRTERPWPRTRSRSALFSRLWPLGALGRVALRVRGRMSLHWWPPVCSGPKSTSVTTRRHRTLGHMPRFDRTTGGKTLLNCDVAHTRVESTDRSQFTSAASHVGEEPCLNHPLPHPQQRPVPK
jgi:hypothetical protein